MMSLVMAFSTPLYTFAAEGPSESMGVVQEETDPAEQYEDDLDSPAEEAAEDSTAAEQQDFSEEISEPDEEESAGTHTEDSRGEGDDHSESADAPERQTKEDQENNEESSSNTEIVTESEIDTNTDTESDIDTGSDPDTESDLDPETVPDPAEAGAEDDQTEQASAQIDTPDAEDQNIRRIDPERSYISDDKFVYTGKSILPEIAVYAEEQDTDPDTSDTALQEGVDYEVFYHNLNTDASDTTNAGVIEVTVRGIGSCTGELKGSYEIVPMDIRLLQETEKQENETAAAVSEGRFNDTNDVAYLCIEYEKNGKKTIASSMSESVNDPISLLEYTDWKLKAMYYEVKEGKIVKSRNVTDVCYWESSDLTGNTLSVASKGVLSAFKSDSKPYNISAHYYQTVDGQRIHFEAKMGFKVTKLKVSSDSEAMRCLAFHYLLSEQWDELLEYQYSSTIEELALNLLTNDKQKYLRKKAPKYSATMNHFISAAAGPYTPLGCMDGEEYMRAALFKSGSKRYLAFSYRAGDERKYTDTFYCLIQEGIDLYSILVGEDDSDVIVTGAGLGGVVAKYFSYTKGCRSVTFNAKSAMGYAAKNAFADMCINYDPDNFISYNFTDETYDAAPFCREYYYRVNRVSSNTSEIAQMISYNDSTESIRINKTSSAKQRPAMQREWSRNFYLGDSSGNRPQMEPSVTRNFAAWVCFGGKNNDTFKYTEDRSQGASIAKSLKVAKLIADAYPGRQIYGVGKAVFDAGVGIEEGEKLSTIAGGIALEATDFMPDMINQIGGAVGRGMSMAQVAYDFGELIAGGIYPDRNIFVGGEGNDTMYGSPLTEWYFYTEGDGHDIIYDGKDGRADNLYILGIDKSRVSVSFDPEQDDLLKILIDGQPAIDFYMEDGGVSIFYESPFDDRSQTGDTFFRSDILDFASRVRFDEVASMHEAACPVDMLILDANGNIVQELLDGTESSAETEEGLFEVVKSDGEYIKTAILYDKSLQVILRAVGDGTMMYAGISCDDEGRIYQYCSVDDIPVRKGAVFTVGDDFSRKILETKNADGSEGEDVVYDTSLQLSEHEISLKPGEEKKLSVEFTTNSVFKDYFWFTTDDTVATVDEEGNVTAVGAGAASVTAVSLDGSQVYDTCRVTVTEQGLSVQDFTVKGLASPYLYTGEELEISLDISYQGTQLIEGTDYEIDFPELVEPGEYSISISGLGRFEGTMTLPYAIEDPTDAETVEEKVLQLVHQCSQEGITDDWDIALWFHDWLVYNANYDYTYTNYMADGVLLKGTGVCNSYSLAYKSLLDAAGIENRIIISVGMNHAWNMVCLDGEWCHVDCTWDDPGMGGAENHSYFGMTDEQISLDHSWEPQSEPSAVSVQNYYPVHMGLHTAADEDELFALLNELCGKKTTEFECYYIGTDLDFTLAAGFENWFERYNWKYGVSSYGFNSFGNRSASFWIEYTDPWEEPAEFTGKAPCPMFILRGPEGVYDLQDYTDNGMVLIFGRYGCLNTSSLLTRLNSRVEELREAGIEVIMNLEAAESPEDISEMKDLYPNLTYTYGDSVLMSEMLDAVESDVYYVTYPLVFFINKNAMITFYSQGYVKDIEAFIEEALATATGKPLPPTRPDDPSYDGAVFRYDGDDEALEAMVRETLARRRKSIMAKDATWNGSEEDWNAWNLCSKLYAAADKVRKNECDFELEGFYYRSYPCVWINVKEYDCHKETADPAVAPTCTETGLTEGSHCEYCGIVMKEQEILSAMGHKMEYHEAVEASCEMTGSIAHYSCSVCGKSFEDEEGEVPLDDESLVTYGHDIEYHEAVPATCEQDGTEAHYRCRLCGRFFRDEKGLSPIAQPAAIKGAHRLVYRERIEPTCEEDGQIAFYVCDVCGKEFTDEEGNQELTGDKAIPHGHDYSNWISNEDGTHDVVCTRDESHRYTEDCSYTYTILQEETESTMETGLYTCDKCGYRFIVYKSSDIRNLNIELSEETYVYDGKEKKPAVTVEGLKEGSDYYVTYENNINAGTAKAIINGRGNYTGSIELEFTIQPISIKNHVFKLSKNTFTYDGKAKEPAVTTKGLTVNTDFSVVYKNNLKAGTAQAVIRGKGNYTESVELKFLILPGKTTRGDMFNLANNVKVTWKEVPGAKYYKVYREGVTSRSESLTEPVIVTAGLVGWDKSPGLTNGHAYRYRIVASLTGKGDSSGDSPLSYSKLMYRLKTVVIRSVKNTAPGQVTVKYDKSATGDSYVLQYCERQDMVGAKTKVVLGANNTSYTIGGLKKGKTYYISIRVRKKVNGIDYYTTFGVAKKITITK